MTAVLLRTGGFLLLWLVLTELNTTAWGFGLVGAILAALLSMNLLPPSSNPTNWLQLLRFAGFFLWSSLKGGAQVALLALQPRPNLKPQIKQLTVDAGSSRKQKLLLTTLTLMPGTLGVATEGKRIEIHVLNDDVPLEPEVQQVLQRLNQLNSGTAPADKGKR